MRGRAINEIKEEEVDSRECCFFVLPLIPSSARKEEEFLFSPFPASAIFVVE